MQIKANGITFNYQIDGPEGAPWLIFSNSLATNLSMWDEQVAALKDSYRILRYDQRGHGKTEAPAGAYSFDQLVADVIALMDALSIRKATFAGISMGGMTALFLAQRHADRFDRIIACDCGPNSTPASVDQWNERIAIAEGKGMDGLVDQTVGRWFAPEVVAGKPPFVDKVRDMVRTTPVPGFVGCCRALSDFDMRPGLGAITTPTLVIAGTKDAALPGSRQIHAAVPGSKMVEIEGAGHLANLDGSAPFTQAVKDFLKA
jgi:3-oxoadipate enol-lactonase